MIGTATLQTPKTPGRSRFSKALPAPPSFSEMEAGLPKSPLPQSGLPLTPRKPLPQAPAAKSRLSDFPPPLPPPKEAAPKPTSPAVDLALPPRKEVPTTFGALGLPRSPLDTSARMAGGPSPTYPSDMRSAPASASRPRTAGSAATKSPIDSTSPYAPPEKLGGGNLQRAIPRRPVANKAPVLPPTSPAEKSPVESLSSLLSAYTDHSDDSARRSTNSSNDSASTKASYLDASPRQAVLQGSGGGDRTLRKASDETKDFPLPPLQNDPKRNQTWTQRPQTPPTSHTSQTGQGNSTALADSPTLANVTNSRNTPHSPTSSPRQPQIWQRRSEKADKSLEISDLKLLTSHGSTAASVVAPPLEAPPTEQPDPKFTTKPKQPASTSAPDSAARPALVQNKSPLPGRNIRPSKPTQEPPAQVASAPPGRESSQFLGGGKLREDPVGFLSKVEGLKARLAESGEQRDRGDRAAAEPPVRFTTSNSTEKPISPGGTAPPVKLHHRTDTSTSSPPQPNLEILTPQPVAPPVIIEPRAAPSAKQLRAAKSNPNLNRSPPGVPTMGLPTSPAAGRAPQPQGSFPPRGSSRPVKPQGSPQLGSLDSISESRPSQDSRYSEESADSGAHVAYPASEELSNEEGPEEDLTTDHPGAALFPRGWFTLAETDVQPAVRAITMAQRTGCYTGHRVMGRRHPEGTCAVACQACNAGTLRYRVCAFCTLLLCEDCTWALGQHGGDLQAMLDAVSMVPVEVEAEAS